MRFLNPVFVFCSVCFLYYCKNLYTQRFYLHCLLPGIKLINCEILSLVLFVCKCVTTWRYETKCSDRQATFCRSIFLNRRMKQGEILIKHEKVLVLCTTFVHLFSEPKFQKFLITTSVYVACTNPSAIIQRIPHFKRYRNITDCFPAQLHVRGWMNASHAQPCFLRCMWSSNMADT